MYEIGDIVKDFNFDHYDTDNHPWFRDVDNDQILLRLFEPVGKRDKKKWIASFRSTVREGVVLGTENIKETLVVIIAIDNYEEELTTRWLGSRLNVTLSKKGMAAKSLERNEEIDFLDCNSSTQIRTGSNWRIARRRGTWVMPVLTSEYNSVLENGLTEKFYPSAQTTSLCSYYTNNFFPKTFSGNFRFKKEENGIEVEIEKPVNLILHGFLDPQRRHKKFVEHVCIGETDSETAEWNKILEQKFKNMENMDIIRHYISKNFNQINARSPCTPSNCNKNKFKKTHNIIKDPLNYYSMSNFLLTFFGYENTKRRMYSYKYNGSNVYLLGINAMTEKGEFFISLEGVSYDWSENTEQSSSIHLNVTTFYADRLGSYNPNNNRIWNENDRKIVRQSSTRSGELSIP